MRPRREEPILDHVGYADVKWFRQSGVNAAALMRPSWVMVAKGSVAHDDRFEPDQDGERWFAFYEFDAEDILFWQSETGRLTTWAGRAFALGEDIIDQPATYCFDCALNIFADPLNWLRAKRDGIVVIDWSRAFDRLRDVPRIAIAESLLPLYRRHMKPARLPDVFVMRAGARRAA